MLLLSITFCLAAPTSSEGGDEESKGYKDSSSSGELTSGAIAGIVVGTVVAIFGVLFTIYVGYNRIIKAHSAHYNNNNETRLGLQAPEEKKTLFAGELSSSTPFPKQAEQKQQFLISNFTLSKAPYFQYAKQIQNHPYNNNSTSASYFTKNDNIANSYMPMSAGVR
eukprot:1340429-Rhodomonas_salina.2